MSPPSVGVGRRWPGPATISRPCAPACATEADEPVVGDRSQPRLELVELESGVERRLLVLVDIYLRPPDHPEHTAAVLRIGPGQQVHDDSPKPEDQQGRDSDTPASPLPRLDTRPTGPPRRTDGVTRGPCGHRPPEGRDGVITRQPTSPGQRRRAEARPRYSWTTGPSGSTCPSGRPAHPSVVSFDARREGRSPPLRGRHAAARRLVRHSPNALADVTVPEVRRHERSSTPATSST